MAFYADEEDVWKCLEHPSRRRRIGVCPACLRERLAVLCSECAMVRPCACCSSASSSSPSSLSLISFPGDAALSRSVVGGGFVGRASNFMETEPSLRRSRSVAVSIFKSARFAVTGSVHRKDAPASVEKSKSWFWLFFWPRRVKREKIPAEEEEAGDLKIRTITRSRSAAASTVSAAFSGGVVAEPRSVKSKGWYFPIPMKVFRYTKTSGKNIRERSPLDRS